MKTNSFLRTGGLFVLAFLFTLTSFSQKQMASPRDSVNGMIGKARVSINYGSPSVKGRVIWGDLVPYSKVWRAGANEATIFRTTEPLMVEGKALPAGTYAFFAIPGEKEWTIIFNKTAKQWGAFKYEEKDDALRVTVKSHKSAEMHEHLAYMVNSKGISLVWENLEVPVMMK